jgi:hypothetical protein
VPRSLHALFGFCVFCALKTHFGFNFVCLAKMNQNTLSWVGADAQAVMSQGNKDIGCVGCDVIFLACGDEENARIMCIRFARMHHDNGLKYQTGELIGFD